MKKTPYLDKEEQQLIESYQRGEYVRPKNAGALKKRLTKAASDYVSKNARINIRLSESDLHGLKIRAAEEGLPYQTLIASVLHKYVSGRLRAEQ